MRIRKRSVAALSKLSCESKPEVSCSSREEEQVIQEKEFLFPLVKAAMDVQAQAQAQAHVHFGGKGGRAIAQIQSRPLHKWRNALLRCTTQSHALQESREDDKLSHRWDGIIRSTGRDKFRLVTSEDGYEKKALDVGAAMKKQRSKPNCTKKIHAHEERKISPMMKGNEGKAGEDSKKVVEDDRKKVVEDNNKKNMHAGSQCRRRNGRGWRCSERTLVGYHLCEHHLGKGRLRSINNSAAKVVGNGKGAKFKELKLINAAAASASASHPV